MAFVNVEGEVSRTNRTGTGFGVKESWQTRDGATGTRYWSVFPNEPAGVQVGDRVKVSGRLGTKAGDPKPDTGRVFVDHTINGAKVERTARPEAPQEARRRDETPPAPPKSTPDNLGPQNGAEDPWGQVPF